MKFSFVLVTLLSLLTTGLPALASDKPQTLSFVSTKSDKINVRRGPGKEFPIDWVLLRRHMPLKVVARSDEWMRVRDWQGTEGWVHRTLLTPRRSLVILDETRDIREKPVLDAQIIAKAKPGVMGELIRCDGPWCQVKVSDHTGWLPKSDFWGADQD